MLFGNRPADKTAKWRVTTRSFAVLLAYTLFIWWLEVLDLLAWLLHYHRERFCRGRQRSFMRRCHGGNRKI